MIIVQIIGGLGNQMFQYAAARALALANNTEVKLDISGFKEDQLRNFDLANLNTHFSFAEPEEIETLKAANSIQRVTSFLTPYPNKRFYKQTYFHFDENFFKLKSPIYIKGYFQSERFFLPVKEIIRKEFEIMDSKIASVKEIAQKLNSINSVSIHVRRGDYTKKANIEIHGVLPIDYFTKAIAIFKKQQPGAEFFIFSDDIPWVEKNLPLAGATLVSGKFSFTHFEDLYLMSQCRHNIIANSSFSWWGAWLGTSSNKMVVAPDRWFRKGVKDLQDLRPIHWQKI